MIVEDYIRTRLLSTVCNYISGIRLEYVVQEGMKARNAYMPNDRLGSIQTSLRPNMLCDNNTMMVEVISTCFALHCNIGLGVSCWLGM